MLLSFVIYMATYYILDLFKLQTTYYILPFLSRLDHWEVPVFTAWPGGDYFAKLSRFFLLIFPSPYSPTASSRSQEEKHSTIPTAAALGLLCVGICSWFGFWEPSHWFAEETMLELLGEIVKTMRLQMFISEGKCKAVHSTTDLLCLCS